MPIKEMTGKRFGKLVVTEFYGTKKNKDGSTTAYWKCKCDCGKETITSGKSLRRGFTKSCGCRAKGCNTKYANGVNSRHRLYRIWKSMEQRCKKREGYKNVSVCDEWKEYKNFATWALQNGYKDSLSIDRIDNNGNYEPSNCRWATATQQANNTSRNHYVTIDGITHTLKEWSRICNVPYNRLQKRINSGWDAKRAIITPQKSGRYKERFLPVEIPIGEMITQC